MQLPDKIKDTAPSGTTFTSLGSVERKINEIIDYLEVKENFHSEKSWIPTNTASSTDPGKMSVSHSETKEPMFKAEDLEVFRNSFAPEVWEIVGFKTKEAAQEALLKLTK